MNGSQAKIVLEMPKHGEHNFDVTLYVPKRSDLRLNLEVGDLTIKASPATPMPKSVSAT